MCNEVIYSIFESRCFDEDPEFHWAHRSRSSKDALATGEIEKRLRFGQHVESLGHTAAWYYRRVVWTDACNDILPLHGCNPAQGNRIVGPFSYGGPNQGRKC